MIVTISKDTEVNFDNGALDTYKITVLKGEQDLSPQLVESILKNLPGVIVTASEIVADPEEATVEEESVYPDKALKLWNKAQLTKKATELNLEFDKNTSNKNLVALIEEATAGEE